MGTAVISSGHRRRPSLWYPTWSLGVGDAPFKDTNEPLEGVLIHGVDVGQVGYAEKQDLRVGGDGDVETASFVDIFFRLLCDHHFCLERKKKIEVDKTPWTLIASRFPRRQSTCHGESQPSIHNGIIKESYRFWIFMRFFFFFFFWQQDDIQVNYHHRLCPCWLDLRLVRTLVTNHIQHIKWV